jgi:squalene cyclase|eukprot:COSAG02_NODE_2148_length_9662_cov_197.973335_2_plen_103_part_00
MWLLPDWFPFHPGRLWCHCRMVYLPMGYIYSRRFAYPSAATDKTTAALREELYVPGTRYESIHWDCARHTVADIGESTQIVESKIAVAQAKEEETDCERASC